MRRVIAWLLIVIPSLIAGAKFLLDNIGRYHDATWLVERAGPILDFIVNQPAFWFYGLLLILAIIGLSLHVPLARWAMVPLWLGWGPPREFTEILPGASFTVLASLSTQGAVRRKYLFSYPAEGGAEVSLYISADFRLVFQARDAYGEEHTASASLDARVVRYNEWTTVYTALGVAPNFSVMSIWLDGRCVNAQRFEFPMRVQNVAFDKGTIAANTQQSDHGRFSIAQFCAIERTLSKAEIRKVTEYYEARKPKQKINLWKRLSQALRKKFAQ